MRRSTLLTANRLRDTRISRKSMACLRRLLVERANMHLQPSALARKLRTTTARQEGVSCSEP